MTEKPKLPREDRAFIRLLGRLLGEVIREQRGADAFRLVEDIRRQSVGEHRSGEIAMDRLRGLSQPEIIGQSELMAQSPRLAESIRSRLPYVDALNHLQVDLLRRRRERDASADIHASIHMSINGVAAGLRNSG